MKRNRTKLVVNGRSLSCTDWARVLGICPSTVAKWRSSHSDAYAAAMVSATAVDMGVNISQVGVPVGTKTQERAGKPLSGNNRPTSQKYLTLPPAIKDSIHLQNMRSTPAAPVTSVLKAECGGKLNNRQRLNLLFALQGLLEGFSVPNGKSTQELLADTMDRVEEVLAN